MKKNKRKHFTTKNTHLRSEMGKKKNSNTSKRTFYTSVQTPISEFKRKVGITTEIIRKEDKNVEILSFIVDYDEMIKLSKQVQQHEEPLDVIDEIIRMKYSNPKKYYNWLPELISSYIPKTKGFKIVSEQKTDEWYEFGITIFLIVLEKGIHVDKSNLMRFKDWESTIIKNNKSIIKE